MKHRILVMTLVSVAAFATGCKKEETASQELDNVKAETKEAAQHTKDYTFAQKGEFVAKMESQVASLNKDLDNLSAKVETSSEALKAEAKPKLQAMRDELAQLTKHLDNVRNANESTWDGVKATAQKGFASLKDGFQTSRQWVSEKIAP